MLKGVGPDSEHLYPSFPYTSYQRMSLDDVRDLYAFLKIAAAGHDAVRAAPAAVSLQHPPGLGAWKLLFLDGKPFAPDPTKDAAYNRGAYLVEGPGHCAECHSTRNVFGAIKPSTPICRRSRSGRQRLGAEHHPARRRPGCLVGAGYGVLSQTGLTPDGYAVGESMADVILNTAKLTDR